MEPRFVHDCERCIWLGTVIVHTPNTAEMADSYFCPHSLRSEAPHARDSLITRKSDEPPNYSCMPPSVTPGGALEHATLGLYLRHHRLTTWGPSEFRFEDGTVLQRTS